MLYDWFNIGYVVSSNRGIHNENLQSEYFCYKTSLETRCKKEK